MLIQLPNGNWVDPKTVRRVVARGRQHYGARFSTKKHPAYYAAVILGGDDAEVTSFKTLQEAERVRDEIAAAINKALATVDTTTETTSDVHQVP